MHKRNQPNETFEHIKTPSSNLTGKQTPSHVESLEQHQESLNLLSSTQNVETSSNVSAMCQQCVSNVSAMCQQCVSNESAMSQQ